MKLVVETSKYLGIALLMFMLMFACGAGIAAVHDYTVGGPGKPEITITQLAKLGDKHGSVYGFVNHVRPSEMKLAVFIWVNGWRTKPYWAGPNNTFGLSGTFESNITTEDGDEAATRIAVYLVPIQVPIPPLVDVPQIPQYFLDKTVTGIIVNRQ